MRVGVSSSSPSGLPSSGGSASSASPARSSTCRTSENPLECRPEEAEPDHHVPGPDPVRAEQPVGLHDAGGRAGQVEVVRAQVPGVLGRLAADQRAPRRTQPSATPATIGGRPLRLEPGRTPRSRS